MRATVGQESQIKNATANTDCRACDWPVGVIALGKVLRGILHVSKKGKEMQSHTEAHELGWGPRKCARIMKKTHAMCEEVHRRDKRSQREHTIDA